MDPTGRGECPPDWYCNGDPNPEDQTGNTVLCTRNAPSPVCQPNIIGTEGDNHCSEDRTQAFACNRFGTAWIPEKCQYGCEQESGQCSHSFYQNITNLPLIDTTAYNYAVTNAALYNQNPYKSVGDATYMAQVQNSQNIAAAASLGLAVSAYAAPFVPALYAGATTAYVYSTVYGGSTLANTLAGLTIAGTGYTTYKCIDDPYSPECQMFIAGAAPNPYLVTQSLTSSVNTLSGSINNYLNSQVNALFPEEVGFGPSAPNFFAYEETVNTLPQTIRLAATNTEYEQQALIALANTYNLPITQNQTLSKFLSTHALDNNGLYYLANEYYVKIF
jgi:hypothetical protein